jgi:hypothetical protein
VVKPSISSLSLIFSSKMVKPSISFFLFLFLFFYFGVRWILQTWLSDEPVCQMRWPNFCSSVVIIHKMISSDFTIK